MANIKSAIKRIRSSERKQKRNRIVRGSTRTALKKANTAVTEGQPDEAKTAIQKAISALDRAAGKGIIHKNNASRRKSRLMKKLNKMQQPQ